MKKWLPFVAMVFCLPLLPAHAAKNDTVVVDINTPSGKKPIKLTRKGDGFVGPRGEYYPSFPTKATLTAVYGNSSSKPTPTPSKDKDKKKDKEKSGKSGDLAVDVFTGGVTIRRDGKVVSQIRTVNPNVNGWRLVNDKTSIVIKSNRDGKPGIVEMFDVKTGKLQKSVKSTDVKDGKPAWAKYFAE